MPNSDPKIGDVYYYPYIWKRQGPDALAEKDRPICVTLRTPVKIGGIDVFVLAISKSGYPDDGSGIEIPKAEIARISGLNPNIPRYITTSELNETVSEFEYFCAAEYRGSFSANFMKNVVYPKVEGLLQLAVEKRKAGKD